MTLGYNREDLKGVGIKVLDKSNVPELFNRYLSELKVSKKYLNAEQKYELDIAVIHDFNSWMYKKFHVESYQDYVITDAEKTGANWQDLTRNVQTLVYRRAQRFVKQDL